MTISLLIYALFEDYIFKITYIMPYSFYYITTDILTSTGGVHTPPPYHPGATVGRIWGHIATYKR